MRRVMDRGSGSESFSRQIQGAGQGFIQTPVVLVPVAGSIGEAADYGQRNPGEVAGKCYAEGLHVFGSRLGKACPPAFGLGLVARSGADGQQESGVASLKGEAIMYRFSMFGPLGQAQIRGAQDLVAFPCADAVDSDGVKAPGRADRVGFGRMSSGAADE